MLKPAVVYKNEIEKKMLEYFYTDDMMYFQGSSVSKSVEVPLTSAEGHYAWACVEIEKDNSGNEVGERLIGYITYTIDRFNSRVNRFGAFSFIRGTYTMGKDLCKVFNDLWSKVHRIEIRAVEDNPALRGYDKFLARHRDTGRKLILYDTFKDLNGKWHNEFIYEYINPEIQ